MQRLLGGIKELKIALGTGSLRDAKLQAGRLAANAHEACRIMGQQPELLAMPVSSLRVMLREIILQHRISEVNNTLVDGARSNIHSVESLLSTSVEAGKSLHQVCGTNGPQLSSSLDAYCTEKQRVGAWTKRTIQDFIPKL